MRLDRSLSAVLASPVEALSALDRLDCEESLAKFFRLAWRQVEPPFTPEGPPGRRSGPDHHLGVEHLVDCILNEREPVLNLDHALHVVEIVERCAQSAATGRTLELTSTFSFQSPNE